MRKFICLAVLALSCVALPQVKVTYTTVAVSAKKALAELSQKTGMKLECAPVMDKELLILRLQDAPIEDVMAQIAAVTSGTWTKQGEISYLVANSSARTMEANKVQQRFAAQIAAYLKKQQDALAKQAKETKGEDFSGPAAMFGFMGGSSSMIKLAGAIGAGQLASVPEDGRVVFSTNPTRMQRSLPGSANAIIAEFVVEHNKAAAEAKQDEPAKTAADENMSGFMDLFGGRMKKPKPITSAPAKALVVASRRGMFFGYMLELKLYDAAGKVLASSSTQLSTNMPFDPEEMMKPKTVPTNEGPEIKLSPLATELRTVNGSFTSMGGGMNTKFSKELMEAMKDPVEHDPLSFVHSEALIAISQQRNEQLVANVPDGVESFIGNLKEKGKLTADSFLTDIKGDDKAQVKESNGWMIVSPENPGAARKERTDRVALRTLIRAAQTQGYASLDDLAAYAMKNESPMGGAPASMSYIMIFAPGAMQQGMMGQVNWDLLRLYGMLDSTQRQALRQGTRLPFGQLSPGQQSQISKMVFGPDESLAVENRQGGPNQKKEDPLTEMMFSQMQRFMGGNESDFRTEPTEVMPNGLPSDGYVQVRFSSEPIGQPQTMSTDFGRGMALGPMELGLFKFFKDDPQMSQIGGAMPTMDDIKVGQRSVYNFSFYVAPSVSSKGTLNDDMIPKDAPTYKMTNLPADFQKRIDDMAVAMKNNPLWKMIGQMGGQRGVPPQ